MSTYQNQIVLKGFLGKDPDVRTSSKQVLYAVLSLATKNSYNDRQSGERVSQTTWHRCVAFGTVAESARRLAKGDYIEIRGELRNRSFTDKGGGRTRFSEVRIVAFAKLVRPSEVAQAARNSSAQQQVPA
jgi:single-strand DNA-binding protein